MRHGSRYGRTGNLPRSHALRCAHRRARTPRAHCRIPEPTVDVFWDAVKGDLDAVSKWKEREIDRIDAETAQAARWGAERFRKDLADLDTLDAQGRLNVGSADGALPTRTPIAIPNEYMTAREAKAILDAQRGKVFVNQDDGREAKLGGTQVRKLLSNAATKKSVANGFTITQHNQAAAHIGDLYENATLVEERPDRGGDPNIVAIRRYASPITVLRNGQTTPATAWLTIKESEQNGNRIYSLELLELESASVSAEPRDEGLTSNQRLRARTPDNTVAYPGADVNPRREIGGLYSGAPVAYDRPSLKAVGSNTGSLAYGWGLYATTYKYAAMSYAQDALHEQVWWINRPEGDESHLLVWDEPISQENRERWLAAINSLGLDPRELAHFSYGEDWATHEMTGRQAYDFVEAIARYIIENAHPKQFASTLLARFDIDGMKYGNTYVAFSDEHLRVVRRWVWDPQTQDFVLDTTFLPPPPAARRSIGGRAPRGVPLTAYHALSQEQLLRSLRQGGLVAPSIAVTEAGKARAFGYGECFLFFRREAVDPQANPENFIFPGDAGTPIYPRRWPTQTSVDAVLRRVRALGPEWTATTREEILREAMRVYNVTNESFEDSGLVDVPNALYALYLAESSDGDITPTPDGTRDIARDLAREDPDGFLRVPDFWRWAKAQFKISTRALTPRQATRLMRLAPLKELSSLSPELGDEMTQFHDSAMLALRDIEETRKVIVHPYNVERGFDALKRAIRKPGVSAENSLRHLSADLSLVNTEAELRDLFSRENEWYATGERALNALLRYIRNASGMEEGSYFEAKPMRLVGIDEIRMALIPQNASAELRTTLTESGIPYKTYTEGDRRRAIRDAAAQTRFSIGGNARRLPIEATTRTARIGVFREAQRRPGNGTGIDAKRLIHVADLPDWASRYGLPTALMANGRVLRKLAKKHAFTPELFADLIEAMARPVAGFWEDGKGKTLKGRSGRPRKDLVLILDIRTPNRNGAPAASTLVVLSANGDHTMLTTAYGMDDVGETKYVGAINTQLMLWVDKTRVARMPLLAETTLSLNSFNGPGDPSVGTVPNREEEVKENVRRAIGGVERARRVGAAAALYYGRSPAVAEVANRAIAEIALFNEASRTGKKVSRETVKSAYADFGIQADDADAAQIADRLNAMAKSERWSPRDKQGLSPRDALIPQERHLRATYDIHWSQAEKTAYTRGVEGAFARDAQEIAQTKRAEAEGVLGVAPAASLAKDLCTLDFRNAASEIDDFAKSALSPYRDIQKAVRNLSGHDLDDLWEGDETARRLRVRRQMAEAARRNADEVFADIRGRPDYAETRARIEAEMEAEQAFWAKAKAALRKCGITGKLAEDILDRLWELGYYEHQTGKASAEPVH